MTWRAGRRRRTGWRLGRPDRVRVGPQAPVPGTRAACPCPRPRSTAPARLHTPSGRGPSAAPRALARQPARLAEPQARGAPVQRTLACSVSPGPRRFHPYPGPKKKKPKRSAIHNLRQLVPQQTAERLLQVIFVRTWPALGVDMSCARANHDGVGRKMQRLVRTSHSQCCACFVKSKTQENPTQQHSLW